MKTFLTYCLLIVAAFWGTKFWIGTSGIAEKYESSITRGVEAREGALIQSSVYSSSAVVSLTVQEHLGQLKQATPKACALAHEYIRLQEDYLTSDEMNRVDPALSEQHSDSVRSYCSAFFQ